MALRLRPPTMPETCLGRAALLAFLLMLGAAWGAAPAGAQPITFGSADDPREQIQRVWWSYESTLEARAGASLLGSRWRATTTLALDLVTRPVVGRLEGTLRSGHGGPYRPDVDEWYDLVRLVRFLRYNAGPASPLYLRAGPLERLRLGPGHLVDFFRSEVAWEERTVGLEGALRHRYATLAAFTDNVFFDGVAGGRLALRPLAWTAGPRMRSLQLGLSAVTDLGLRGAQDTSRVPTAYSLDVQLDALTFGSVSLTPFASFASYVHYGRGLALGLALESPNFIDLARFRLRATLHLSGDRFLPGYFGAFYTVSNLRARIVAGGDPAGVPLHDVRRSTGLETELRLLVFDRFELWQQFYRHYGPQDLSTYHLRLFFRSRGGGTRLHLGLDRAGLGGLGSLFSSLGDLSALTLGARHRLRGRLHTYLRARYTFEPFGEGPAGADYYRAERRFAPMLGLRFTL